MNALLAVLLVAAPAREVRLVMGGTAEVQVVGLADPRPALDAAFAALDSVDASMSLWKDSELTALNSSGRAQASPALFETLRVALEVAKDSGGAFDPTVEPLVRAGGGLGGARRSLGRNERRHLLARVGFARVALDPATREVRLEPGTRLDLGGVAKGYAVDLALAALRQAGATGGLVDLGRSSQGAFGWNLVVDVADPQQAQAPAWARFDLGGAALSSSGGDQRPEHILDPRSGLPARRLLATTVLAAAGAEADALSTAAFVLGQEHGLALLGKRGAEGLMLWRDARGRRHMRTTPGFAARHGLATRADVEVHE